MCVPPLLAQEAPKQALPQVTVTGTSSDPVEKSYRKMVQGMDYFERVRPALAPNASLRFKLLPRKPGTRMDDIGLELIGTKFDYQVPVAADRTFMLAREPGSGRLDPSLEGPGAVRTPPPNWCCCSSPPAC